MGEEFSFVKCFPVLPAWRITSRFIGLMLSWACYPVQPHADFTFCQANCAYTGYAYSGKELFSPIFSISTLKSSQL